MSNASQKIRVMINDDQFICRQGLVSIINSFDELELIAEFSDSKNPVTQAAIHQPHVLILSVRVIQLDFNGTISRFIRSHPDVAIIAMSDFTNAQDFKDAHNAGVHGFLVRNTSGAEVLNAITTVHQARFYCHGEIVFRVGNFLKDEASRSILMHKSSLSAEEKLLLQMMCKGMTLKEIAGQFRLTRRGIEARKYNLYLKFEARNVAELMNRAIQQGLYNPFASHIYTF